MGQNAFPDKEGIKTEVNGFTVCACSQNAFPDEERIKTPAAFVLR